MTYTPHMYWDFSHCLPGTEILTLKKKKEIYHDADMAKPMGP